MALPDRSLPQQLLEAPIVEAPNFLTLPTNAEARDLQHTPQGMCVAHTIGICAKICDER